MARGLRYWLQSNAEKVEGLVLDRRWPGHYVERIVGRDRGGDGVARQGRQIAQQRVETVHWQSVLGQTGGLLGDRGRGALCWRDDARSQRVCGVFVGVVEQHRCQALTHVPFQIVGEHAQEDMRAHPIGQPLTLTAIDPFLAT